MPEKLRSMSSTRSLDDTKHPGSVVQMMVNKELIGLKQRLK